MTTSTGHHSHCKTCGRRITAARSLANGRGPVCQARYEALTAVVAAEQPTQIAKAAELIDDRGLIQVAGSLWQAASSDGTTRYQVDAATGRCTCPAGRHGRRCYHLTGLSLMLGHRVDVPAVPANTTVREPVLPADPFACFPADVDPFAADA